MDVSVFPICEASSRHIMAVLDSGVVYLNRSVASQNI